MKQPLFCRLQAAVPMAFTALLSTLSAQAQDRAELERSTIVGNRELPKVLYIVPWKQPLPGVPSGKPLHSVLDEALAPLDRAVFRRQIDYSTQLQQQLQASAQGPAPARGPSSNPNPPVTSGVNR